MLMADACIDSLGKAFSRYGGPEVFNTYWGNQFTSLAFMSVLKHHKIRISIDGNDRWRDKIFVERLWQTIKYEHLYIRTRGSMSEAVIRIVKYIDFCNRRRPHKFIERVPLDIRCRESLPEKKAT